MFSSIFPNLIIKSSVNFRTIKSLFQVTQPRYASVVSYRFLSTVIKQERQNLDSIDSHSTEPAFGDNKPERSDREYPIFNSINYEEIAGNDEELFQKLNVVVDQMRKLADLQKNLPTHIKLNQWHELLKVNSFNGRQSYLRYLYVTERSKTKDKIKRAERQKLREEMVEQKDPECRDLDRNTLLLVHHNYNAINKMRNFRALQAMMFGPKIIIDCSYDEFMTGKEIASCARQLSILFGINRAKQCPLDLNFVNFNQDSGVPKFLHRLIPSIYENHFPFNWSSKCYLDLFPQEKLVYLTPHCEERLDVVNHDDIYIVGAMVDTCVRDPLSLAKAKKAGIRYAKLPLDEHLNWGDGIKSLTVDQCVNIVGDALIHGSWEQALKTWVPQRKLRKDSDQKTSPATKNIFDSDHVKSTFKRNIMLDDFLINEQNGEKS